MALVAFSQADWQSYKNNLSCGCEVKFTQCFFLTPFINPTWHSSCWWSLLHCISNFSTLSPISTPSLLRLRYLEQEVASDLCPDLLEGH